MPVIYSMLTNDQSFPVFKERAKGSKVAAAKYQQAILIKGGANIANKHRQTQKYFETTVTDEELELLQKSPVFLRMAERGFVTNKKPKDLKRDKSAPNTEKDLKKENPDLKISSDGEEK
ncbi:conserved hypothetical protein [Vibrio chagasii]|nr:conserved hypothetical protein [Vibrio chagasii]